MVKSIMGCLSGQAVPDSYPLQTNLSQASPRPNGHHSKTPSVVIQPPRLNTSLSNCNFDISDNNDSIENMPCLKANDSIKKMQVCEPIMICDG